MVEKDHFVIRETFERTTEVASGLAQGRLLLMRQLMNRDCW